MSISVNNVFLGGNLTRDPELRYTANGSAVCSFDLAVNRRFTSQDETQKEETLFIRVSTFGRQAETCHEFLTKGSPVLAEGWLSQSNWETEAGEKRSRIEMKARRVQFLGASGSRSSQAGPVEQAPPEEVHESDVPF